MNVYEQLRADHMDKRIGVTASCFDLMHAGHHLMLKEAKSMVGIMVVFLQTDPTVDRPEKNKPILSMDERRILVQGCKYVDHIFEYTTEAELLEGLRSLRPDLRILGNDYVGKTFTGSDLNIPVHFHDRSVHGWSTSELRKKIWEVENPKRRIYAPIEAELQHIRGRLERIGYACELEPDVTKSAEESLEKLRLKHENRMVPIEEAFTDEHGVNMNAVIADMKARNREAHKLQKAFETPDVLAPTFELKNAGTTSLDELRAQNPKLDADIRKIEIDLQKHCSEGFKVETRLLSDAPLVAPNGPGGPVGEFKKHLDKLRSKHEQGPHNAPLFSTCGLYCREQVTIDTTNLKKAFEDEIAPSFELNPESNATKPFGVAPTPEFMMSGPRLLASNEAAPDVEYWRKVRSQFENEGAQPTEGVRKNFQLPARRGLYPFECRMDCFGSDSEWYKSVARVRAKKEEWGVIHSLQKQFIAEWTAKFMEKLGNEQGRSEFNSWWLANQLDLTRAFVQIAAEYVQDGGKAEDVSLHNFDLRKYGIADLI